MVVSDQDGVLACFGETAPAVFEALCHLTARDVDIALDLTVETYAYLTRIADGTPGGVDVDRRWMIGAAHSVYAAGGRRAGPSEPIAGLAPLERVTLSLQELEHWPPEDVAALVDLDTAAVQALAASAAQALGGAQADDAFRACEVWFDDQMRADVRAAIATGTARASRPRSTVVMPSVPAVNTVFPTPAREASHADMPDPDARPRRSRRITVAAMVATGAVVGALALWVRPAEKTPEAETVPTAGPTTSASRPPETTTPYTATPDTGTPDTNVTIPYSTTPDTTTTPYVPRPPLTGFVSSALPDGFQAGGGYADARDSVSRRNWFELWSSEGATRTSGRWFGLVVVDEDIGVSGPEPAAEATRVAIAGRPALARLSPDRVTSFLVELPGGQHVDVQSFGYTTDELTTLLGAMEVGTNGRVDFGVAAAPLLDGLERRAAEPTSQPTPSLQTFNHLESSAFYLSADGVRTITVNAGAQSPNDLLASRLLSPPPAGPAGAFAPDGLIDLDGIQRVTGTLSETDMNPTLDPYSFVQWHQDGLTITVMGDVPAEQLFEVARHVQRATPDQWVSQSRAVPVITPTQPSTLPAADPVAYEISSTHTDAGPTWTVTIDNTLPLPNGQLSLVLSERRAPNQASTGSATYDENQSRFGLDIDPARPVHEYNTIDATIVVVVLTSPPEGAKIRLTRTGQAPEDGAIMALVPVDDQGTWVAGYAFSENSDYTVELMEINGSTVISTLSQ